MKYKYFFRLFVLCAILLFRCEYAGSQDKNWTHFRGSNLNGIAVTGGFHWSGMIQTSNGKQKYMTRGIHRR